MGIQATQIDISHIAIPDAIETLSFADLRQGFVDRFVANWTEARAQNPNLPLYDVEMLHSDPAMIHAQAFAFARLVDRARVNDGLKTLFGITAKDQALDDFVANKSIQRLIVEPATDETEAVYETDLQLFRRYLLSHDRNASGSSGRYLFDAYSAMPSLLDAKTNSFAEHGRRGDTQLVLLGTGGTELTAEEINLVAANVRHEDRMPDGMNIGVRSATINQYNVDLTLMVNAHGPAHDVILTDAQERIILGTDSRMFINGKIPEGFIKSLGFGEGVIDVRDNLETVILPDPYSAPKRNQLNISLELV